MKNRIKRKAKLLVAPITVVAIAIIGVGLLIHSHAATPYVAGSASKGQLSGDAVAQKDATASSGSSVTFDTPDCVPSKLPTASIDTSLDSTIDGQLGPGWVGGDAAFSTELPNGQEAFDFSDTLIGTATAAGTATFTGLIHSSELVGALPALTSVYGGTYSAPTTLLTDTNATTGAQWQVQATYVENNEQLIFVNQFVPTGSDFDSYTGVSGVAVMTLPTNGVPTYTSVTAIPSDTTTQWGNAAMTDGTYHYIYGFAGAAGMKLARVPLGDTLTASDWQYWNGTTWVSGEASAVIINTTNQLNGVVPSNYEGGYEAISIPAGVYDDKTVDVSYACAPQGPWSTPVAVYTIPEVTEYPDILAYMANFHPELNNASGMVLSYDINNLTGLTALAANIHEYQPRFVYLK